MGGTILEAGTDSGAPNKHRSSKRNGDSFAARVTWAVPWLALLVAAGALAPFRGQWFVQMALLSWLLLAPGRLLLAALRVKNIRVRRFPVYTVAMSLLLIMGVGLMVDGLGVAFGDAHPLRTGPLWSGTAIAYLALVAGAGTAPERCRPTLRRAPRLWPYAMLILPILAAAGAARINSGHGSAVAITAMTLLVGVWLIRPFLPQFTWRTASITAYAVSLAGIWSFSLRGDSVFGYDVITEYFIGRSTAANAIWHLDHINDAYGALLSVTILPTSLHSVTGVAVINVFKVVLPAIFAFVPVGILRIAQHLVPLRFAYVAVGLVIGQQFFFSGMPAVARQEIAFVFFVALLGALLSQAGRTSLALGGLSSVGMIVAHYSTTYMAIALTGVAFACAVVGRLRRHRLPIVGLFSAFLVLVCGSFLWYHSLTGSASNVSSFFANFSRGGFDLLPNRRSNIISSVISGNVSSGLTPARYSSAVARYYSEHVDYVHPFSDAGNFQLRGAPNIAEGGGVLAPYARTLLLVIGQLINALSAIGALILLLGKSRTAAQRSLGLLSFGVVSFLVVIRLSGTVALAYNQERAQIQAFILLGPLAIWTAVRLGSLVMDRLPHQIRIGSKWSPRVGILAATATSSLLIANAAGILASSPSEAGTANVSADGEDVARFVLESKDLMAAAWLNRENPENELSYADTYGRLRILAERGGYNGVLSDITPLTISQGAWVYAYSQNIGYLTVRSTFQGHSVKYRFPISFIDGHLDIVYTNGTANVYHG